MPLMDDLKAKRAETRAALDTITTRAADEQRDLTADELDEFTTRTTELRELDDRVEGILADQVAELRAATTRTAAPIENRGGTLLATEIRALTTGADGGAAFSPSEYAGYFLDKLSASSVLLRSGVRVVRTTRDSLVVPKWVSDTTAAWYGENSAISSTDADADPLTATPRKLAALQALSNEVINDSNPAILDAVSAGMVRSIGLKFDLGAFEGSGTPPEITGLKNLSGITTDTTLGNNGAVPANLDFIAGAISDMLAEGADAGAIVMHPDVWGLLSKIKETSGSTVPLLNANVGVGVTRSLFGVPVLLSSQLSVTETQGTSTGVCASVYVYDPAQVVAVMREDVRVELDRSRLFNYDSSELRAVMRADVVVPNPKAVTRIVGVKFA